MARRTNTGEAGPTPSGASPRERPTSPRPPLGPAVAEAVFRHKPFFLLTTLLVLLATAALILLLPKQYNAEATLQMQKSPYTAALGTPDEASPAAVTGEVELLRSPAVARRALGAPESGVEPKLAEEQVRQIGRKLSVHAVSGTDLIRLDYIASSPDDADRGLQRLIDAYLKVRAGNSRAGSAEQFFNRQLLSAKQELDRTGRALTDYGLQHSIANLDDEKRLQLQRVSTLEDQLHQADATLALQRTRQAREQQQLIATPSRLRTTERSITNQYAGERLTTSLVELQNRRAELVRRYAPSDRQILELDDKIANTRLAINDAANKPATEAASDVNPVYQQLSSAVAMAAGEVSGTAAQRGMLQAQFEAAQRRLDELETATVDVDALKRDQAVAEAQYTLYASRRNDARMAAELANDKLFDVNLVQPPFSSTEPVRPRPVLYGTVGALLAVLAATLAALFADARSGILHTPGQLEAVTGVPAMATLAAADSAAADEGNALQYRRLLLNLHRALRNGTDAAPAWSATQDTPHGEWPRENGAESYVLALTSAGPHEGVSYVADRLASEAARQFGSNVAVLDTRAMLKAFETERRSPDPDGTGVVSFGLRHLPAQGYWVLSTDTASATAVRPLGTRGGFAARLGPWLQRAREEMDLILLDCPSNRESTLGMELDASVDGYLAIVEAGRARQSQVDQLAGTLAHRRAPLLGYVLNRWRSSIPRWLSRAA